MLAEMDAERLKSELMDRYPKAVVHLRSQYNRKRFGLVLGSGVSQSFDIPSWQELLERISKHPEVQAPWRSDQGQRSPITAADLLRCHFDARTRPRLKGMDDRAVQCELTGRWLRIIRDSLYKRVRVKAKDLEDNHPYLGEFLEIILECRITINYNFDDCIEMMLNHRRETSKDPERICESAYDDFLGTGAQRPLIYHPNGFLPRNALEGCSDDIVLSEREFNEQSGHAVGARADFLAQHFAANTCLFLGLSVQDELLRSVLRRAAKLSPGQFHYCVEFLKLEQEPQQPEMIAISRSRRDNYNLITLFLTQEKIAALGMLIKEKRLDFLKRAERKKHRTTFIYYLTGVPGVGKTSVLRHFHSLHTHGEWIEDPPSFLSKPYNEWTKEEEKKKTPRFFARQFELKNKRLWESPEGLHLVEATPLDWVPRKPSPEATEILAGAISNESERGIRNGTIIHLIGDSKEIAARLLIYHRLTQSPGPGEGLQPALLDNIATAFAEIYPEHSPGIFVRRTDGCALNEVVRKVAEIVFSDDYVEFDIATSASRIIGNPNDGSQARLLRSRRQTSGHAKRKRAEVAHSGYSHGRGPRAGI